MVGHARLFISQEVLDRWTIEDGATLDGEVLTLRGGAAVRLTPAVRILKVSTGDTDPHGLCGRVKSAAELTSLGGEQYMNSLLLGEVAYDVQSGFMAEPPVQDAEGLGRLRAALLRLS
jgi:hypothetical protein